MNSTLGLCQSAFESTLAASARIGVLIILVLVIQKALASRITPGWRYALNFLVVIGLLMPVTPRSSLSLANLWPMTVRGTLPVDSQTRQPLNSAILSDQENIVLFRNLSIWRISSLVWLSGCAVLIGIAAWRHQRWRLVVRTGETISDSEWQQILESAKKSMQVPRSVILTAVEQIASPAVFGLRRVHLLIPRPLLRELSPSEARMVFLHELAHIKRQDIILNWVLIAVQFLHWFNPLVWLALRRFRADRELVCDAMVLARIGASRRHNYAEILLKLVERFRKEEPRCSSAVSVMGGYRHLKWRIDMIKHPRKATLMGNLGMIFLLAALGCSNLTSSSKHELSRGVDSYPSVNAVPTRGASDICRIDIKQVGSSLINEESIRSKIGSKVGRVPEPATVDDDVRKLYATGFFYNVRAVQESSLEGITLTFVVQENPVVIAVNFAGNTKFSDADLRKEVSSHSGEPLSERRLFADTQKLQELYRKLGCPNTQIQYSYRTEQESARTTVVFQIAEGPHNQ